MVYEPSFSIFYEQLFHVDIEELFEDRIVALLVEGINEEGIKPLFKQMLPRRQSILYATFHIAELQ